MTIDLSLRREITNALMTIPNIHEPRMRRVLVLDAGLDDNLVSQISFVDSAGPFFQLLLSTLLSYGTLRDGRDPLVSLLEAAKNYVGGNKVQQYDALIDKLGSQFRISPSEIENESAILYSLFRVTSDKSKNIRTLSELAQLLDGEDLRTIERENQTINMKGTKVKFFLMTFKETLETIRNYSIATSMRTKNQRLLDLLLIFHKLKDTPLIQEEENIQNFQDFQDTVKGWVQLVENELKPRIQEEYHEIPNPFIYGNPIYPEDADVFVGRDDVVERIETLVTTDPKATLFLHGKRRSGKTSTLLNLNRFIADRVICIFIDLEDMIFRESSEAFCRNLSEEIANNIPSLKEIWQQQNFAKNPFSCLSKFLDTTEKFVATKNQTVLLSFDEYERLDSRNKDILDTLRSMIQHRQRIIVLVAGSHRFDEVKEVAWADYLINTQNVEISWLDRDSAYRLLTNPTEDFDMNYPEDMPDSILELTHCQPYLLQAVARELVSHLNFQRRKQVAEEDLRIVLKEVLTSADGYFVNCWTDECSVEERDFLEDMILQEKEPLLFNPADKILRSLLKKDILENTNNHVNFSVPLFKSWIQEKQLMMSIY